MPASDAALRLPEHAQLHAAEGVLVLADGARVPLNAMAASVLVLCDGSRGAQEIAQRAAHARGAPAEDIAAFLSIALDLGWLTTGPHRARR